MSRDPNKKITVEDLIRLKRSEQPAPEYWAHFEAQMRAKQLAAIVVKRPWWDGSSRIFARLYRHSLPIGGVAAVALAWVSLRYSEAPASPRAVVAAPVAEITLAPAHKIPAPAPAVAERPAPVPTRETLVAADSGAAPSAPVVATTTSHLTKLDPVVAQDSPAATPFADGMSVTLADFHVTSQVPQHDSFGSDKDFETTSASSRQQDSDPLARLDPSAERRARLLGTALPAYASQGARPLTASLSKSRSGDDRIYESMDLYSSNDRAVAGFRF